MLNIRTSISISVIRAAT